MPGPSKYKKGKKLSEQEYKYKLQKYYQGHIEKNYRKFQHKCIDKPLFAKIKQEAKKKFKVFPSSYATNWIKSEYKKRGGKLKSKKRQTNIKVNDQGKITEMTQTIGIEGSPTVTLPSGQTVSMDGSLFFNTKDSNLYTVEEETNERKIVERRGDAKEGDLWVHPNTGNLKMKVGDKWVTVNNPNELPKINNQKRRKELSDAFAERRKKEQIEEKIIKKVEKAKITRGQFLHKYKSPQNFYSWQDLAREHINCSYRNQQYIYNSPAYYLKDDLCNSLINTNIDNLKLSERPNIVNPSFFLLNSNKINTIKYSFIECHKWSLKGSKLDEEPESFSQIHDVYVNFVIDPDKILYFAFSWKDLKMPKFSEMNKLRKDPYSEEEIRCFKDQFHTVVNLLLLMNQQPDIITEEYIPSKVIDIQKKYKIQSPIKPSAICWVGKDFTRRVIKLKPKMNEEDFVISGNTRKIRPHWRRGHWHTVLKGKNRKERKMRWYQPVFVMSNAA